MSAIPDAVRFHFARQAPSPWNWYTKPEFAGCLLLWTPPVRTVGYIIFRTNENLPNDCCEDLLNGMYEDVADRIDIFKDIYELVDDEIHDRNRYLVLARLDNDDIVCVNDVESRQFEGAVPGEELTYWSNPFGNEPKVKDPCRLNYETIRVGPFCGFEWDYPDGYPDFLGYELIVSDVPYSPHTGADLDIRTFREVLDGTRGTHYKLERFVNAIVDNETFVNRFWYYALLILLPEGGRIQIPMRHVSTPFPQNKPFQNLSTRQGWGVGRDRMMAAYGKWKTTAGRKAAVQQDFIPEPMYSGDVSEVPSGVELEFFNHAPALTLDSYLERPEMIGIQFSAKLSPGTQVIAVRADRKLKTLESLELLKKAVRDTVVTGPHADAFSYVPKNGYMLLVDTDCHHKSNYAFATYVGGKFEQLGHVKDVTLDYISNPDDLVRWGESSISFKNRVVHFLRQEGIQKKNLLALEFGIIDETTVDRIELYRFDEPLEFNEGMLDDWHGFQSSGKPSLGARYEIDHRCKGIMDDVSPCNRKHYYSAVSLDREGNRMPLSVFNMGNQAVSGWEMLSKVCDVPAASEQSVKEEEAQETEVRESPRHSRRGRHRYDFDAIIARDNEASGMGGDYGSSSYGRGRYDRNDQSSAGDSYSPAFAQKPEETPSAQESSSLGRGRRRFNWDEPSGSSDSSAQSSSPVPEPEVASVQESSSLGRGRRRFNWDEPSGSSDSSAQSSAPEPEAAPVQENSSFGRSRRRFNWDEPSGTSDSSARASAAAQENSSLGRSRRRFNWDEPGAESESSSQSAAPEVKPEESPAAQESSSLGRGRRRFNWDEPGAERESSSQSAAPEAKPEESPAAQENSSLGRSRRRFNWDEPGAESKSSSQSAAPEAKPEESPAAQENSSLGRSRRRFNWDEPEAQSSPSESASTSRPGRSRFNWDEPLEPEAKDAESSTKSEDSETQSTPSEVVEAVAESASTSRPGRSRFNWDEPQETEASEEIMDTASSTESEDSEAQSAVAESASTSRPGRSRFNWDEPQETEAPEEVKEAESSTESEDSEAQSTQSEVVESVAGSASTSRPGRSRFNWDEPQEAEAQEGAESSTESEDSEVQSSSSEVVETKKAESSMESEDSEAQSSSSEVVETSRPGRSRFNWDEPEEPEEAKDAESSAESEDSEERSTPSEVVEAVANPSESEDAEIQAAPSEAVESPENADSVEAEGAVTSSEPDEALDSESLDSIELADNSPIQNMEEIKGMDADDDDDEEDDLASIRRAFLSRSSFNTKSHFAWEDDEDEELPAPKKENATAGKSHFAWEDDEEAKVVSAEELEREDDMVIELLSEFRRCLNDGEMEELSNKLQEAKATYPHNLRIQAFEWYNLR